VLTSHVGTKATQKAIDELVDVAHLYAYKNVSSVRNTQSDISIGEYKVMHRAHMAYVKKMDATSKSGYVSSGFVNIRVGSVDSGYLPSGECSSASHLVEVAEKPDVIFYDSDSHSPSDKIILMKQRALVNKVQGEDARADKYRKQLKGDTFTYDEVRLAYGLAFLGNEIRLADVPRDLFPNGGQSVHRSDAGYLKNMAVDYVKRSGGFALVKNNEQLIQYELERQEIKVKQSRKRSQLNSYTWVIACVFTKITNTEVCFEATSIVTAIRDEPGAMIVTNPTPHRYGTLSKRIIFLKPNERVGHFLAKKNGDRKQQWKSVDPTVTVSNPRGILRGVTDGEESLLIRQSENCPWTLLKRTQQQLQYTSTRVTLLDAYLHNCTPDRNRLVTTGFEYNRIMNLFNQAAIFDHNPVDRLADMLFELLARLHLGQSESEEGATIQGGYIATNSERRLRQIYRSYFMTQMFRSVGTDERGQIIQIRTKTEFNVQCARLYLSILYYQATNDGNRVDMMPERYFRQSQIPLCPTIDGIYVYRLTPQGTGHLTEHFTKKKLDQTGDDLDVKKELASLKDFVTTLKDIPDKNVTVLGVVKSGVEDFDVEGTNLMDAQRAPYCIVSHDRMIRVDSIVHELMRIVRESEPVLVSEEYKAGQIVTAEFTLTAFSRPGVNGSNVELVICTPHMRNSRLVKTKPLGDRKAGKYDQDRSTFTGGHAKAFVSYRSPNR